MAVGLREATDWNVIRHSPEFIKYLVDSLDAKGIPVITPAGGLGAHLDARGFLPHLTSFDYPAGALAAALYIVSGVRGMERGTISMDRDEQGNDVPSEVELLRLAFPRRVFTLSQVKYAEDRIEWLWKNRELIGGLKFTEEPEGLAFLCRTPCSDNRLAAETACQIQGRFWRQFVIFSTDSVLESGCQGRFFNGCEIVFRQHVGITGIFSGSKPGRISGKTESFSPVRT